MCCNMRWRSAQLSLVGLSAGLARIGGGNIADTLGYSGGHPARLFSCVLAWFVDFV